MSDMEPMRNVRPIRADVELEAEKPKRARKPKTAKVVEDRTLPEFADADTALTQVLKTTASVQRAEAKASELGKAIGQETKNRRASLEAAVEGIEGNSAEAVEVRAIFAKLTAAEDKRKTAGSAIKKGRETIAEMLEQLPKDAHGSVKSVRNAWMRLEKHKAESSEVRAEAKAKVTAARQKRDAAVDGARQLALML